MQDIKTVEGTFPLRPLILVCVEDYPKAVMLLHVAQKRAQARQARWRALFIETPSQISQGGEGLSERIVRLTSLAENMGGEAVHLEGRSKEEALKTLLEKEGERIALVIIARADSEGRFRYRRTSSWQRMAKLAQRHTEIEIVSLPGEGYHRSIKEILQLKDLRVRDFLYALLAVGGAFLVALGLENILTPDLFRLNEPNVALLFMIACAFAAGRYGLLPGLTASIAGFAVANYYFIAPYHHIDVFSLADLLNAALFLSAALLISLFTSQMHGYAHRVLQREISTQALFTLYRLAADSFSREQVLEKLQQKLEHMLSADVAFFLPQDSDHPLDPASPTDLALEAADRLALDACWAEMRVTGFASPYDTGTAWRFEPIIAPGKVIGALGIRPRGRMEIDAWFSRLLTAIADQTATVLEHIELERAMEETRLGEEREKLRSMLLSSVSHDFKTPLAGIIGALSVYRSLRDKLSEQKRQELLDAALEEAQRLDSFITNILDMTRLESGKVSFRNDWQIIDVMLGNVTRRLHHRCREHTLRVDMVQNVEVYVDGMMMEQVFQNLIDNACKYTPSGTCIDVRAYVDNGQGVICKIRDYGPGMPPERIDRVFDKYARLQKKDAQVAGTGLGLAICKAVIEAQGGWITAANHPEGGAEFTLCLPRWRKTQYSHVATGDANAPRKQAHRRH